MFYLRLVIKSALARNHWRVAQKLLPVLEVLKGVIPIKFFFGLKS